MLLAMTDWTNVLVALIAGLPAILSAVFAYLIHRDSKIPSGGTLGEAVEKTHALAAISVGHTTHLVEKANGGAATSESGASG